MMTTAVHDRLVAQQAVLLGGESDDAETCAHDADVDENLTQDSFSMPSLSSSPVPEEPEADPECDQPQANPIAAPAFVTRDNVIFDAERRVLLARRRLAPAEETAKFLHKFRECFKHAWDTAWRYAENCSYQCVVKPQECSKPVRDMVKRRLVSLGFEVTDFRKIKPAPAHIPGARSRWFVNWAGATRPVVTQKAVPVVATTTTTTNAARYRPRPPPGTEWVMSDEEYEKLPSAIDHIDIAPHRCPLVVEQCMTYMHPPGTELDAHSVWNATRDSVLAKCELEQADFTKLPELVVAYEQMLAKGDYYVNFPYLFSSPKVCKQIVAMGIPASFESKGQHTLIKNPVFQ